jgi:hypothetical protein
LNGRKGANNAETYSAVEDEISFSNIFRIWDSRLV